MKLYGVAPAGALVGGGLALWLVWSYDAAGVTRSLLQVGWLGLTAIVAVRAIIVAICGLAWACLLRERAPGSTWSCVRLRFVREAVNVLLPVASVGGDILGARLILLAGVPAGLAGASIIVDLLMQASAQAAFALVGVIALRDLDTSGTAAVGIANAVGLGLLPLGAFFFVQRIGAGPWGQQALGRLALRWPTLVPGGVVAVQRALDQLWHRAAPVLAAFALHSGAWLLGTCEVYIALRVRPISHAAQPVLRSRIMTEAA